MINTVHDSMELLKDINAEMKNTNVFLIAITDKQIDEAMKAYGIEPTEQRRKDVLMHLANDASVLERMENIKYWLEWSDKNNVHA